MDITTIYYDIDNFCKFVAQSSFPRLSVSNGVRRVRQPDLCPSEVMTILVWFHHAGYRRFKQYYQECVASTLNKEFPCLPSYTRFIELAERVVIPLGMFLTTRYGQCTGISFIDSTALDVCQNQRISQHKVFKGLAARSKTSTGWFYGFKLHLAVNERGELLGVKFTTGNVDDRTGSVIDTLTKNLWGKLIADKGYLSKSLFDDLYARGIELITKVKKNMANKIMPMMDKKLLRKRALIGCVIDALKNQCQIEHSRHRSVWGGITTILPGLVMCTYLPKKPSLRFNQQERQALDLIQRAQ